MVKVDQSDWIQDSAVQAMESVENTPVLLVGSIVAGCLATAFTGLWPVGVGVAGAGMWLAEKRHGRVLDSVDYSIKYGAAPTAIRNDKALREYSDHMGREQTAKQLLQAAKSDVHLNGAQWRFLEDYYEDKLDELLDQPASDRDVNFFHEIAPIRLTPKLEGGEFAQSQAISDSGYKLANPIEVLGDRLRSLLMIAPPGAGKGIIISNLIRHFKTQNPSLKVYAFDGKNMHEETGYWLEGFDEVVRVDLDRADPAAVAHWVEHLIKRSHTTASDSILLLDELNALIGVLKNGKSHCPDKEDKELCGAVLGTVLRKLATAASTGDGRNNHVWGIGQVPNLSSLGLNGGEANQLRKVAIAASWNPVHTDQLVMDTGFTGTRKDAAYREGIKQAIALSPIGRAFYDSATAKWYAMPVLPNYSGFDRDNRQQVERPQSANLPKSRILVGHGSESEQTVLQQQATPTQVQSTSPRAQEPSATQLQDQGLMYVPSVISTESPATAIASPTSPQPQKSNVVAMPQNPLQQQYEKVKQAIAGNSDFQEQLRGYAPILKQLMSEQRRDLVTLALFSLECGAVKARDVYNKAPSRRKLFHPLKFEGIRLLFEELEAKGVGEVIGDDSEAYYRAFLRDDRTLSASPNSDEAPVLEPEPEAGASIENNQNTP